MKLIIMGFAVAGLMVLSSCGKDPSHSNTSGAATYGTWTFKGHTYPAASCTQTAGPNGIELVAFTTTIPNVGSHMQVVFDTFNPPAGTYYVCTGVNVPQFSNQVYIAKTDSLTDPNPYGATGGNGLETVQVTVVGGKLHITGSGIMLFNLGTFADSSTLSFNITQQ